MHDFTPIPAAIGGALIGLAAALYLFTHGRIAGIAGIYGGVVRRERESRARWFFLAGLVVAAIVIRLLRPEAYASAWTASLPMALVAGIFVGVGTQVGNGCTSGHGVCGLSRLSIRSLVATLTFMATAGLTVFIVRHVLTTAGSR